MGLDAGGGGGVRSALFAFKSAASKQVDLKHTSRKWRGLWNYNKLEYLHRPQLLGFEIIFLI